MMEIIAWCVLGTIFVQGAGLLAIIWIVAESQKIHNDNLQTILEKYDDCNQNLVKKTTELCAELRAENGSSTRETGDGKGEFSVHLHSRRDRARSPEATGSKTETGETVQNDRD